jgi:hypothetical protein
MGYGTGPYGGSPPDFSANTLPDDGIAKRGALPDEQLAIDAASEPSAGDTPSMVSLEFSIKRGAHGSSTINPVVTPSAELLRAFEAVQDSLTKVEILAANVLEASQENIQNRFGIGGNFPPEEIEQLPLSSEDERNLKDLMETLGRQTPLPGNGAAEAVTATVKARTLGQKIQDQVAKRTDEFATGFFNKFGEGLAIVAAAYVCMGQSTLGSLGSALVDLAEKAYHWLTLAGIVN